MVCSMIRKSVWEQQPFDERITYAEDAVWSFDVIEQGYSIHYVSDAVVEHSHNYTWQERYRRSFGDQYALSLIRSIPPARTLLGGVVKPFIRRCATDCLRLLRRGLWWQWLQVPMYRWPQLSGAWHGYRKGWGELSAKGAVRSSL